MFFPSVVADIHEVVAVRFDWRDPIPARMAPRVIVIGLVVSELVIQVRSSPEEFACLRRAAINAARAP